jgi:hypothetical protein
MKIPVVRTLSGWVPADDEAWRVTRRWDIGEIVKVDFKKARDQKSLSRYWVLVEIVLHNSEQFKTKPQVHEYFKRKAGHVIQIVEKSTGNIYEIADSIDYDTLDENEFQEVWRRVVDVVCMEILPGITEDELELEIMKICGLAR